MYYQITKFIDKGGENSGGTKWTRISPKVKFYTNHHLEHFQWGYKF